MHLGESGDDEWSEAESEKVGGKDYLRRGRVDPQVSRDVIQGRGNHARRHERDELGEGVDEAGQDLPTPWPVVRIAGIVGSVPGALQDDM